MSKILSDETIGVPKEVERYNSGPIKKLTRLEEPHSPRHTQ